MRLWAFLLFLAGISLAPEKPRPAVEFLQPRSPIILAGLTGSEIPVQIRVEPHADNRAYAIVWCDGASAKSLDGENDAAVQPIRPLVIRVFPGRCDLTATVFGPGAEQVRARATLTLRVCGGEAEECAHDPE